MAEANPIRYRGYYYDTETSLYYLKSRYYDSEVGRFISSDEVTSTGQGILGTNMFAYCLNNPACVGDTEGKFGNWLIGGVVGAAVGAVSALIKGENVLAAAAQGAVSGAIAGAGVDIAIAIVATGGIAGVAVAGLAAYGFGFGGSLAGEYVGAKISGTKFNADGNAYRRANAAGLINVASFGLSTVLEIARVGVKGLNHTRKIDAILETAFKDSTRAAAVNGVAEIGYDIVSAHQTIHTSIWGSIAVETIR